ncbi:MAG TPA: class I SAM-dependent methyltransferase [Acetobacteraceae bacterium]|nr:class I SAM-dependent methyltransferase [Acetobacteraceae bacterium]
MEVGCGGGTESLWAAMHGASVVGIDILETLLAVAEARQRWIESIIEMPLPCVFLHRSVLDLDDTEGFGIVYLEQAFHHLEPRPAVIQKLARLVRSGGYLILSEANAWNPLLQIHLLRLRGITTITTHQGHAWGHERITVPFALARQFKTHGFVVSGCEYFRVLPNLKCADVALALDRKTPSWMKPLFTHYNLVLKKTEAMIPPSGCEH